MRPAAKTTLLPFSTTVERAEPFSADKEALKGRINKLQADGGTLLYDATYDALDDAGGGAAGGEAGGGGADRRHGRGARQPRTASRS